MIRSYWILALTLVWNVTGCSRPDRPDISLYLAVHRGDLEQVERHLYWGTDLNAADADGRMPLHVSAANGSIPVARLLLEHGAAVDGLDAQGHTPLHHALMAGRTQLADELVRRGATVDVNTLLWAMVEGHVRDRDVLAFLLRHGVDLDARNARGDTPLLAAIRGHDRVIAKLLIQHGAAIDAAGVDGVTALHLARSSGEEEIERLLLRQGARDVPAGTASTDSGPATSPGSPRGQHR